MKTASGLESEGYNHDARAITQGVLKKCNVYREKNQSIPPLRPGHGQQRWLDQSAENHLHFTKKKRYVHGLSLNDKASRSIESFENYQ